MMSADGSGLGYHHFREKHAVTTKKSNVSISSYTTNVVCLGNGSDFLKWIENYSSAFFCVSRLANCVVMEQNYSLVSYEVAISLHQIYTLVLLG